MKSPMRDSARTPSPRTSPRLRALAAPVAAASNTPLLIRYARNARRSLQNEYQQFCGVMKSRFGVSMDPGSPGFLSNDEIDDDVVEMEEVVADQSMYFDVFGGGDDIIRAAHGCDKADAPASVLADDAIHVPPEAAYAKAEIRPKPRQSESKAHITASGAVDSRGIPVDCPAPVVVTVEECVDDVDMDKSSDAESQDMGNERSRSVLLKRRRSAIVALENIRAMSVKKSKASVVAANAESVTPVKMRRTQTPRRKNTAVKASKIPLDVIVPSPAEYKPTKLRQKTPRRPRQSLQSGFAVVIPESKSEERRKTTTSRGSRNAVSNVSTGADDSGEWLRQAFAGAIAGTHAKDASSSTVGKSSLGGNVEMELLRLRVQAEQILKSQARGNDETVTKATAEKWILTSPRTPKTTTRGKKLR